MAKRFRIKIRAGETFLYRKNGTESQVFEIRLNSNVGSYHIERAAKIAYKRYPYFKSRFKIIDGSVYLCENHIFPPPKRSNKLRSLGGSETLKNLLDITYYKNSIYISFHHAMCDGRGIMQFIKTLMYYYLNFKYPHNNIRIPGVRLVGEAMLPGETDDPVNDGNLSFEPSKVYKIDRTAFAIPEVQEGEPAGGQSWRYELSFKNDSVLKLAKSNNCTPIILMAILMQKGIKALNISATEPILCSMSCDWRDAIELPNTFRNCVSSIYLPYGNDENNMDLYELGKHYKTLITKQKEIDSARCNANVMKMMSDMLDSLGDYDKKVDTVTEFISKPINSFVCSYTGKADMGDAEKYIESIHVYSSGSFGINLQMMSIGNTFTLDFLQNFPNRQYVDAFISEAEKLGLRVKCSKMIPYRTPKDKTGKTNKLENIFNTIVDNVSKIEDKLKKRCSK